MSEFLISYGILWDAYLAPLVSCFCVFMAIGRCGKGRVSFDSAVSATQHLERMEYVAAGQLHYTRAIFWVLLAVWIIL